MISWGDLQGAEKLENAKSNVTNKIKHRVRQFRDEWQFSQGVQSLGEAGYVALSWGKSSWENKLDSGLILWKLLFLPS